MGVVLFTAVSQWLEQNLLPTKHSKHIAESKKEKSKFQILCSDAKSSNHLHEFSKKTKVKITL